MRIEPVMILVIVAQKGDQGAAIGDDVLRHGSVRVNIFSCCSIDRPANRRCEPNRSSRQPNPSCFRRREPCVGDGADVPAPRQIWRRGGTVILVQSPRRGNRAIGRSRFSYQRRVFWRGRPQPVFVCGVSGNCGRPAGTPARPLDSRMSASGCFTRTARLGAQASRARRCVMVEVTVESNFITHLVLAAVHPRIGNVRQDFAAEIVVYVLFERHVLKVAQLCVHNVANADVLAVAVLVLKPAGEPVFLGNACALFQRFSFENDAFGFRVGENKKRRDSRSACVPRLSSFSRCGATLELTPVSYRRRISRCGRLFEGLRLRRERSEPPDLCSQTSYRPFFKFRCKPIGFGSGNRPR